MPGHFLKCLPSSSTSSGIADSVVVTVSTLYVYFGLLLSILVVYFLPPGPLLIEVLVMADPGEEGRFDLAIVIELVLLSPMELQKYGSCAIRSDRAMINISAFIIWFHTEADHSDEPQH
jgi:hypothetical protein